MRAAGEPFANGAIRAASCLLAARIARESEMAKPNARHHAFRRRSIPTQQNRPTGGVAVVVVVVVVVVVSPFPDQPSGPPPFHQTD